ncbi:MAG: amidohydrolase family protein, partial [Actinomycetes bacterium]
MTAVSGLTDDEVAAWCAALGIPGLVDAHVHFLPPRVMARVREHFDTAGPLLGRPWPVLYRGDDGELLGQLRALGVRRFTALPYAHRPGIAGYLNDWAAQLAAANQDCVPSATFFPEPGVTDEVRRRLDAGVRVFKVHVQVGDFSPVDPLLDDVWALLADSGTPVVLHAGSGPVPNRHTGPDQVAELLRRHPGLGLVLAHMGAPEYAEFLELIESSQRACLDTTMAFTGFFEQMAPYPTDLLPRVRDLGLAGRVLLGSDFPNIPYPYAHQLESLSRLDLGSG